MRLTCTVVAVFHMCWNMTWGTMPVAVRVWNPLGFDSLSCWFRDNIPTILETVVVKAPWFAILILAVTRSDLQDSQGPVSRRNARNQHQHQIKSNNYHCPSTPFHVSTWFYLCMGSGMNIQKLTLVVCQHRRHQHMGIAEKRAWMSPQAGSRSLESNLLYRVDWVAPPQL